MYGNAWTFPTPDIMRTQYLVVMGANPHASQGSLLVPGELVDEISGNAIVNGIKVEVVPVPA